VEWNSANDNMENPAVDPRVSLQNEAELHETSLAWDLFQFFSTGPQYHDPLATIELYLQNPFSESNASSASTSSD